MKSKPRQASIKWIRMAMQVISAESTLVLAVADTEGQTHATPLFYLPAEALPSTGPESSATADLSTKKNLDLFWLSSISSLHSQCLAADPRASVAIHDATFAWKEIAGIQMRGLCSVVKGRERAPLLARYRERFHLGPVLALAIRQSTLYRFHPTWVRIVDNRQGFGWKAEFSLGNEIAAER